MLMTVQSHLWPKKGFLYQVSVLNSSLKPQIIVISIKFLLIKLVHYNTHWS